MFAPPKTLPKNTAMKPAQFKLTFLFFLLPCAGLMAQHSFYLSTGYGYSGSRTLIGHNLKISFDKVIKDDGVYGSFAKGARLAIGYGYSLKDQLELTFDYNHINGADYSRSISEGGVVKQMETLSANSSEASVNLKMNMKIGSKGKSNLFLKAGPVAGWSTLIIVGKDKSEYPEIDYQIDFSNDMSIGVQMYSGIEVALGGKFFLTLSAGYCARNFSPSKSEVTSLKVGGADRLSSLPVNFKVTEYKTSYVPSSSAVQPSLDTRVPYSASCVSFNAGLKFKL
jgi:hypothetical protein